MASRSLLSPRWLRRLAGATADLVFPPACAFCEEPSEPWEDGSHLCPLCVVGLGRKEIELCPRCAMPAPREVVSERKCPQCRNEKYAFTAIRSLGFYEKEVRQAVLKIKHEPWEHLAIACGRRLATVLAGEPFPEPPDLVVP